MERLLQSMHPLVASTCDDTPLPVTEHLSWDEKGCVSSKTGFVCPIGFGVGVPWS